MTASGLEPGTVTIEDPKIGDKFTLFGLAAEPNVFNFEYDRGSDTNFLWMEPYRNHALLEIHKDTLYLNLHGSNTSDTINVNELSYETEVHLNGTKQSNSLDHVHIGAINKTSETVKWKQVDDSLQ